MFNTSKVKDLISLRLLGEGEAADLAQEATADIAARVPPTTVTPGQNSAAADCVVCFCHPSEDGFLGGKGQLFVFTFHLPFLFLVDVAIKMFQGYFSSLF